LHQPKVNKNLFSFSKTLLLIIYFIRCADPCPGACGIDAQCKVTGHNPACACRPGYTGNAYDRCTPIPVSPVVTPTQPPPTSYPQKPPVTPEARPECVLNSDCPSEKACVNRACIDPCPGVCGPNAICKVNSHNPICSCVSGYIGDPTRSCYPRRNTLFHISIEYQEINFILILL